MEAYQRLEEAFAAWAGLHADCCVSCSSGTAALHLALEALQLAPSTVAVPDYTFVACARAVTLTGLRPAFVDCGPDLLLDPEALAEEMEKVWHPRGRINAVMPVHVYGRRCNMEAVAELAGKYELRVVEDMAEAPGVPVHSASDAACWSFQASKVIAGEEGGMCYFREREHAARARLLRNFGQHGNYLHAPRGHNYRLANLLAREVLEGPNGLYEYEGNLQARRVVEGYYERHCPAEWRQPARAVPWVYDVRVRGLEGLDCVRAVAALREAGVEARHGFKPMTWQEEYRGRTGEGAAAAATEVIVLPLRPGMCGEDCQRAFDVLRAALA